MGQNPPIITHRRNILGCWSKPPFPERSTKMIDSSETRNRGRRSKITYSTIFGNFQFWAHFQKSWKRLDSFLRNEIIVGVILRKPLILGIAKKNINKTFKTLNHRFSNIILKQFNQNCIHLTVHLLSLSKKYGLKWFFL